MGLKYSNPLDAEQRQLSRFGKFTVAAGCLVGAVVVIVIIVNVVQASKAKEVINSYRAVCNAAVSTCKMAAGNDKSLLNTISAYEKKLEKAKSADKLNNLTAGMITEVSASIQNGNAANKQYLLDELIGAMNEVNYVYSEILNKG